MKQGSRLLWHWIVALVIIVQDIWCDFALPRIFLDNSGLAMPSVPAETLDLWERLHADTEGKDVELKAKDGSVWAHSLILSHMWVVCICTRRTIEDLST